LDALQAAILRIKLRYLDTWNQQRHTLAQRYHQLLYPLSEIITPQEIPSGESVWNQYTIRVQGPLNSEIKSRDYLRNYLQEQGIGSMIYYPIPLHQQPVYQYLGYQANQFPIVERVCQEVLSLPLFPELSPEQQDQVITAIKEGLTQIPQL
jgi:dTDP-4-amino-4,6-dideoxygalactose transaminase